MRLIDADECEKYFYEHMTDDAMVGAMNAINEMPTIDPVKHGKWNVIKKRPMDEEERLEWSERIGYDIEYDDAFIYTNLPDDGEEVLICYSCGSVTIDTFRDDDGCYFEDVGDMDGIVAWMPLPKPYKEGERSEE